MNPNQCYGSPPNYVPMQNPQPYYQPPMMTSRPPDPLPIAPQASPMPQFNQSVMNQQIPLPQYNQPQFPYGNGQNVNFSPVSPPGPIIPQYQPVTLQNAALPSPINIGGGPPIQQDYQFSQPGQPAFYPNQIHQNFTNPNPYNPMSSQGLPDNAQLGQNVPVLPVETPVNFYNPPQTVPQQIPLSTTNEQIQQQEEPIKFEDPLYEKVKTFRPTNVMGDYKCSDFPNLYIGPFRYSTPMQRKPFTMNNTGSRSGSTPNPAKKSQIGLGRNTRNWELRGGKYLGCFASRTNGLQENSSKAKCKSYPANRKR